MRLIQQSVSKQTVVLSWRGYSPSCNTIQTTNSKNRDVIVRDTTLSLTILFLCEQQSKLINPKETGSLADYNNIAVAVQKNAVSPTARDHLLLRFLKELFNATCSMHVVTGYASRFTTTQ